MSSYEFLSLATKPSAKLCYSFQAAVGTDKPALIVFINGLGLPQTSWEGAIARLQAQPPAHGLPALLTYDRYGQGQTTDRDPDDAKAENPMHGHDTLAVVRDLRQLITQVASEKLGVSDLSRLPLVLVSNSIGGALVRLYAQEYPGTVAGLLFLDSVLANSDFISIYPDPDAPGFDETSLPDGVSVEAIRDARAYMQRVFHPSNGSGEGLSRRNLAELLPKSDGPRLQGPDGRGPWVTVIGHEFETFKVEFEKMGGAPPRLTEVYMNPYWHRFNEGLAKLTDSERSKGPFQAPGAGHFVQRDNPDLVANELREMLDKAI
ncbi:alpha/beta-hydrolase [Aspergillus eucalypticola CBS 122712]|uniref:Alpha/beta-hydrolase n=1 Tax=Aspergillus eucalypticola (strain CBS 122712 / IBT 29274) TaxID=1448314 RepID=A0A317UM39_ASPEC|nr:alpha/beta-hydrolase [Aspergillus eucalypticola CBS 122712]PWY62216.1 alpha/beta-hydrolase [Aspergillus eucalypticola CBS 122712]